MVLILGIPSTAQAYLLPEEVLMSEQFYVPPRTRESEMIVRRQSRESALRREEEQDAIFAEQHPIVEEEFFVDEFPEEQLYGSAYNDSDFFRTEDIELLRTLRLLERVVSQQEVLRLQSLHGGAPYNPNPLAPTGIPSILTALTMFGAVGYTIRRAGKRKGVRVVKN